MVITSVHSGQLTLLGNLYTFIQMHFNENLYTTSVFLFHKGFCERSLTIFIHFYSFSFIILLIIVHNRSQLCIDNLGTLDDLIQSLILWK
jgi:hypothetical protein